MKLGYVIYSGPSEIDGSAIVAIVTLRTTNGKTGDMLQTWILSADVAPVEAVQTGADYAICGDCPLRGQLGKGRACYVVLFHAPGGIWRAWKSGKYPLLPNHDCFAGRRSTRLGAYGDPAAVPIDVWLPIIAAADQWTGYTHHWKKADSAYRRFLMASVESAAQRAAAKRKGYRTFRILGDGETPDDSEVYCPATREGGGRRQCATCLACAGNRGRDESGAADIATKGHGTGRNLI